MIPLSECTQILNEIKGKRKYAESEIKLIRDTLIRFAEIEHLNYQIDSFTKIKPKQNENNSTQNEH